MIAIYAAISRSGQLDPGHLQLNYACMICGMVRGGFICSTCQIETGANISAFPPHNPNASSLQESSAITHYTGRLSKNDLKVITGKDWKDGAVYDTVNHGAVAKRRKETELPEGVMFRLVYEKEEVKEERKPANPLIGLLFG